MGLNVFSVFFVGIADRSHQSNSIAHLHDGVLQTFNIGWFSTCPARVIFIYSLLKITAGYPVVTVDVQYGHGELLCISDIRHFEQLMSVATYIVIVALKSLLVDTSITFRLFIVFKLQLKSGGVARAI